ncbi:MAG: hypothetical protein IPJ65_21170 [Archangiaceae bacterium]|nr:hypothetical protein [Archangiaceae bacterium]
MSRATARAEAQFMRGDTGVDGGATEQAETDPSLVEQAKAKEALYRGGAWLGREALTWLLLKSESSEPLCEVDDLPLKVVFASKVTLRAHGEVTEIVAKGVTAPYSAPVRHALHRKMLVHAARLHLTHGEETFEVTLDAERFDFRGAKLPARLDENDQGEELVERLELVARLGRLVDALLREFVRVRSSPAWLRTEVPALEAWFKEAATLR